MMGLKHNIAPDSKPQALGTHDNHGRKNDVKLIPARQIQTITAGKSTIDTAYLVKVSESPEPWHPAKYTLGPNTHADSIDWTSRVTDDCQQQQQQCRWG